MTLGSYCLLGFTFNGTAILYEIKGAVMQTWLICKVFERRWECSFRNYVKQGKFYSMLNDNHSSIMHIMNIFSCKAVPK